MMADKTGMARLRQAVENQRDAGDACFMLPIEEATAICDEVEDELARLAWAKGVSVPKDADGKVVPLDTKELVYRGETREVCAFSYSTRHGCWGVYFAGDDGISLNACTIPDSWERLEEDVNLGCRDYCEKYRVEECDYNMIMHMLSRARALAERMKTNGGTETQAVPVLRFVTHRSTCGTVGGK